jgi:dephospho-CoA kinase
VRDGFAAGRAPIRHGTADPGRAAVVHLRRIDSPEWRTALLVRDWLRVCAATRDDHGASALRKTPVPFAATLDHAEAWAESSGWTPSFR